MTPTLVLEDVAGIERDLRKAMTGEITFPAFIATWLAPQPAEKKAAVVRYISERIHDVLVAWTP